MFKTCRLTSQTFCVKSRIFITFMGWQVICATISIFVSVLIYQASPFLDGIDVFSRYVHLCARWAALQVYRDVGSIATGPCNIACLRFAATRVGMFSSTSSITAKDYKGSCILQVPFR